jgi:hypothetical protein
MEAPEGHGLMSLDEPSLDVGSNLAHVVQARDLFWRNVMREILTSLSVACLSRRSNQGGSTPGQEEGDHEEAGEDLFDGRMAVLTHAGERIPIAEVYPLFACGIQTSKAERALSMAVECSVFQIRTPTGEVFTLPLQEMRGFHAMTPELMEALSEEARSRAGEVSVEEGAEPFGFAAFTSLSKQQAEEAQPAEGARKSGEAPGGEGGPPGA